MNRTVRSLSLLGTAIGALAAVAVTVAPQAGAANFDCQSLCNVSHTFTGIDAEGQNGTGVASLWYRLDSGYLQALTNMASGVGGVQARAECERRNGGSQWYESTIKVFNNQSNSHYDCSNNGTYNYTILANGADWS